MVRFIQGRARELHDQLADKRPRNVLDQEVVGMAARKVDVKAERQLAGHDDHAPVQLGHVDVQRLAGAGFCFVQCHALNLARGPQAMQLLFFMRREKGVMHRHGIVLELSFKLKSCFKM